MKPLVLPLSFALLAGPLAGCAYPDPIVLAEWDRVADSEILVRALRDGPADSRVRAARAMGRIQSEAYAAPLSSAAGDPDPEVRSAAVFALGQLGLAVGATPTDDAVETCRQVARSAAAATAAGGVECLGKLAREGALPDVLALAGHRDARVREEVAHALMRYRFVPVWRGEVEDPPPFSQEGVRTLVGALADSDVRVRRAAAHALSRYGEPRAVADLVHASGDPDPWVRLFAVRGVGRSGDPASASRIAPRLDDAVPGVRAEAVAALAGLDRADLVGDGARRDPSFHVRAAAESTIANTTKITAAAHFRG